MRVDTTAGISDTFDGQGVAWGDYNGDSLPDLYVSNLSSHQDLLFRNDGGGNFTRIDTTVGIVDGRSGVGAAWGDHDNDGDPDIFVANFSSAQDWLWRNDGGTFTDVATTVGMTDALSGDGAAWADYDGDGDLDLILVNGSTHADRLYRNAAGAGFTDVAASAGVADASNGEGVAWGYLDGDVRIDLFVVNTNGQQDRLYLNDGDGTFTEAATSRGLTDADSGVGVAIADYDLDGDLDLFVANKGTGQDRLWRNDGAGNFTDVAALAGLSDTAAGFGPCWGDYDNDGDLDLFVANFSNQQDFLYRNDGGVFVRVDTSVGIVETASGIGCAWADYDLDGDLDLFVANTTNTQDFLWRNSGNANNWIKVIALTDTDGNATNPADGQPDRLALGAWVEVDLNGGADFAAGAGAYASMLVGAGHGYGQNAIPVHLGAGAAATVDVRVRFPGGAETTVAGVATNQTITVRDPGRNTAPGPNVWYVNDTSTVGDSFTTTTGSPWHDGLSPSRPKRRLNDLEGLLSAGDTVLIDAGFYYEPDTFTIDTNSIWVIGRDSAATVVDFNDASAAGQRAIYADTQQGLTIRDLRVTRGRYGVRFLNVDASTIERVRADAHGLQGFSFLSGADSNTLRSNLADSNGNDGFSLSGSDFNLLESNTARGNSSFAFYLQTGADSNTLRSNLAETNASSGFRVEGSDFNLLERNTARGNSGAGITLQSGADQNTLRSNLADSNASTGVHLFSSDLNTIESNTARSSGFSGFWLQSGSDTNALRSNVGVSNPRAGLEIDASRGNLAHQNEFTGNDTGVHVLGSASGNTVVKNVLWPNDLLAIWNQNGAVLSILRNWYGTTDSVVVDVRVDDTVSAHTPFRLGTVDTTAGADTVAPRAPDTVGAQALGASTIRVSWAAVALDEESSPNPVNLAGYRVHRMASANTSVALATIDVGPTVTQADDTNLAPGTYFYRVTSVDSTTPYENRSFFSDSAPSATVVVDAGNAVVYVYRFGNGSNPTSGETATAYPSIDSALVALDPANGFDTVIVYHVAAPDSYVGTFPLDTGMTLVSYRARFGADTGGGGDTWPLLFRDTGVVVRMSDSSVLEGFRIDGKDSGLPLHFGVSNVVGARGFVVRRNVVSNFVAGVSLFDGAQGATVESNVVSSASDNAISVNNNSDSNVVRGNVVAATAPRTKNGIFIGSTGGASSGNLVRDNAVETVAQYGILLNGAGTRENTLDSNLVVGAGQDGIRVDSPADRTSIVRNVVRASALGGVALAGPANRVEGNLLEGSGADGLLLAAAGNVVAANEFRRNAAYAIQMTTGASACTVSKNVIVGVVPNPDSGVFSAATNRIDATRNWWGTTDSQAVRRKIAGAGADSIQYIPFRLGTVDTAAGADTVAPRAPDTVGAQALGASTIRVSWAAVALDEESSPNPVNLAGYRVHRMASANTSVALATIDVGPTVTQADDTNLAPGTYFYRVTSVDSTTPYENRSFFSDSVASATAGDTSGPNIWYVNDTSTAGDSFTTAVGYDTNTGLSPSSPLRTLNFLEGKLTPGDTVLVDSGSFYEPDTFTVDTNAVWVIGVDSRSTVIDLGQAQARSIYMTGRSRIEFRDIRVTRAFDGFNLDGGVETSVFRRVRVDSSARNGFFLTGGASNLFETCAVESNASYGVYAAGSAFCTFTGTLFRANGNDGLHLFAAETNAITGNRSTANVGAGFALSNLAAANLLASNRADSNTAYGFHLLEANRNTLTSNTAETSIDGIRLDTSSRNLVETNAVRQNSSNGILLEASDSNTVSGNQTRSNVQGINLAVGSDFNTVSGNSCDLSNGGIDVSGASNRNTITGNQTTNGTDGIRLSNVTGETITGNASTGNQRGIYLTGGVSDVVATGNAVTGNFISGVVVVGSSRNVFRRNTVRSNTAAGFDIANSDTVVVEQNEITGSDTGVWLEGSSRNCTVAKNNVLAVDVNAIFNQAGRPQAIVRNWFGTTDSAAIDARVADTANAFAPYRLGEVDTAANADTVAPRAPDTVAAVALSETAIRVSWDTVVASEEPEASLSLNGFNVYRWTTRDSAARGAPADAILDAAPAATSIVDSGLTPGAAYFYRVTADDGLLLENESFFSDSIAAETTTFVDTSGPNAWYVNDGVAGGGDSWTTAVGDTANSGLSPSSPKRFVNQVEPFLTAGDTIFVDAGTFGEGDTVTLNTGPVWVIGVDSALTVIDFNDTTVTAAKALYATNAANVTIRDLAVVRGRFGVWLANADTAVVERVRADSHGQYGIFFDFGSTFCTVTRSSVSSNAADGIAILSSASNNRIESSVVAGNAGDGIEVNTSNANTLAGNFVRDNGGIGVSLLNADRNLLVGNTVRGHANRAFALAGGAGSDTNTFVGNVASNNRGTFGNGFEIVTASIGNVFRQNTADSNEGWAFSIAAGSALDTFSKNVFVASPARPDSGLFSATTNRIDATRNWWGTTDSVAVRAKIAGAGADSVQYIPFRLGTVDTAPGADTVAPRAPDTVAAVALSETAIRVSWRPTTANEDGDAGPLGLVGYNVYRSTTPTASSWSFVRFVATSGGDSTVDSGLAPLTAYSYRVTALDGAATTNEAFFSDSIATETTAAAGDSTPPAAFLRLAPADGFETRSTTVTLSWTASSDTGSGLDSYTVRVATAPSAAAMVVDTTVDSSFTSIVVSLVGSETYYWRVIAIDAAGNTTLAGPAADSSFIVDTTAPAAFALAAPATGGQVASPLLLVWGASADTHAGLVSYRVQVDSNAGFPSPEVDSTVPASNTSVSVSLPTAAYFWRVYALDDVGNSTLSTPSVDTFLVVSDTIPPDTPTGFAAIPGDRRVTLLWSADTTPDVVRNLLHRATAAGGPYALVATIDSPTTLRVDSPLTNGTTYWFRLQAEDSGGLRSESTPPISATPFGETPAAVQNVSATPGDGRVTVSWTASGEIDVVGYRVLRSLVSGGPYAQIAFVSPRTADSYLDLAVTNDSTYFYVVRAEDVDSFVSPLSNEAQATPGPPDTQAPVITHAPVSSATAGETVQVTGQATDNVGVTEARIHFRRSGSSVWSVSTWSPQSPPNFAGVIPADSVQQPAVFYYLFARDAAGNTVTHGDTTNPHAITVTLTDSAPPSLVHAPIATATAGGTVTVRAAVTDSSPPIAILLRYRPTGAPVYEVRTMTLVVGDTYEALIAADSVTLAGVDYHIQACDIRSNCARSPATGDHFISVQPGDSTPPTITHTPVATATVGSNLVLTATITDNVALGALALFFRAETDPTFDSTPLVRVSGDDYAGTIPAAVLSQADTLYRYYLEARDTAGNVARAPDTTGYPLATTATDTTPPQISHTPVATALVGNTITIRVTATDDSSGVASVVLYWRRTGETWVADTLAFVGGFDYEDSIPGGSVTTVGIEYYVRASDTAGNGPTYANNRDSSNPHVVVVVQPDSTPPTVTATCETQAVIGRAKRIAVGVADDQAVASVTLFYRLASETSYQAASMTLASGITYAGTVPASYVPDTNGFAYYVVAIDASGNTTSFSSAASPCSVAGVPGDSVSPTLVHTPIERATAREDLTFQASATDNVGVASVTLYHRTKGATGYSSLAMSLVSGSTYEATLDGAFVTTAGLEYYVEARDAAGNVARSADSTAPHEIRVVETPTDLSRARTFPNPWTAASGAPLCFGGLPPDEGMTIEVYDRSGRKVDEMAVGRGIVVTSNGNEACWNVTTVSGRPVASGVYHMVIRSRFGTRVIRSTIIR